MQLNARGNTNKSFPNYCISTRSQDPKLRIHTVYVYDVQNKIYIFLTTEGLKAWMYS